MEHTLRIALTIILAACHQVTADLDQLRSTFRHPPSSAGTVTLWWLNGTLTKKEIREQMLAMRDECGFSGVAPLTMYRMKPPTSPNYLTEEYFEMYGCILDTAKELGMSVVFYDDCDFPSGTAGSQMAERYPDDLPSSGVSRVRPRCGSPAHDAGDVRPRQGGRVRAAPG